MAFVLKYRRLLPGAVTVVFMLWGFSGMFCRLSLVFSSVHEDMSHAWFVPLFSLYVLWKDRRGIQRDVDGPSVCGLLASLPFLAVTLLGTRGLQVRLEQVGFIGLCVTIPWTFLGARAARHFVFPAAFLVFTIPVSSFLDFFTIRLRIFVSSIALAVLKGVGIEAVQKGTAIISLGMHPFQIDVAEPCSGLRSFFALTTLTAAYSWFNQPTWPRRGLLFAFATPLAVLGNVARILSICLIAAYSDPKFAIEFYHDYSGFIVFIVAVSAMVAAGKVIDRIFDGRENVGAGKAPDGSDALCGDKAVSGLKGLGWTACILFAAVFAFQACTPAGMVMSAPEVSLPAAIPGFSSDEVRYCQNEQCCGFYRLSRLDSPDSACPVCGKALDAVSLGERTILPADTQFRRRLYVSPSGASFLVSAVIGGVSKSSIHRPELCLPAQGYMMGNPSDFMVEGRPFHSVEMTPPDGVAGTLAYTFFNQEGMRTASHLKRIMTDVWDRSVLNRVDRWVMVTVHAHAQSGFTISSQEDRRQMEAVLSGISEVLP